MFDIGFTVALVMSALRRCTCLCVFLLSGINNNIKVFNQLVIPVDDKNSSNIIPRLSYVANSLNGSVTVGEEAQSQQVQRSYVDFVWVVLADFFSTYWQEKVLFAPCWRHMSR